MIIETIIYTLLNGISFNLIIPLLYVFLAINRML